MCVAQPVVVHFKLEYTIHIRQLELDAVLATWGRSKLETRRGSQRTVCVRQAQSGITSTFPLQEGPHEGVNAHKLQLNVISIKGDPLAVGELLNHDAVLLR